MLEERRREAIQAVFHKLQKLPRGLRDGKWGCSPACRTMLLGHFVMQRSAIRFSRQRLDALRPPFDGVSFNELTSKLRGCSNPPAWVSCADVLFASSKVHACTLESCIQEAVEAGMAVLRKDLEGASQV